MNSFGLFFAFQIVVTDLRTISFNVPPQEILTNDSVTVTVDAVVYYKIMGEEKNHHQLFVYFFQIPNIFEQVQC